MKQVLETLSVAMLHSEVQRGWCLMGPELRVWDGLQGRHGIREGLGMGY